MSRDEVGREIRILMELQGHPNIVSYKDAREHRGICYIFMSIWDGGTLAAAMKKKGRFSESEAAHAIADLLKGLTYCHEKGVIHLHLQPENIMFVDNKEDSRLQIIDFGIAIKFKQGQRFYDMADLPLSEYNAPEVFGSSYGKEINVWSAGIILYQLLSGSLPFADAFVRAFDVNVVFTTRQWADVSEEAIDLIKKMLDPNSGTRLTAEQALAHPWLKSWSGSMSSGVGEHEDESGSMSKGAGRVIAEIYDFLY